MGDRIGSPPGFIREGTICQDNGDGTVLFKLNTGDKPIKAVYSTAWQGPSGQFIGGTPVIGSAVIVTQGNAGQWYIVGCCASTEAYKTNLRPGKTSLSSLKPNSGRALLQVGNGRKLFLDPKFGTQIGDDNHYFQVNSEYNFIGHNFSKEIKITDSFKSFKGPIERILPNSSRGIIGDFGSIYYDRALTTIPMDPTAGSFPVSSGSYIRNLPLVENREITYEFTDSYGFSSEENETTKVADGSFNNIVPANSRRRSIFDSLSLDIGYPNHLIETIKGTAVDARGNILDINRSILPIGKVKELSLINSDNKSDAFTKIREQLRKSIAYHFEINTRKIVEELTPPDSQLIDYDRRRSHFFFDVDKEGQFKINIPASSEKGNIPLLTRYENFSTLNAAKNSELSPDAFTRSDTNKEIYLKSFANGAAINLTGGDDTLSGYEAPVDRRGNKFSPIKYGTAHHDITNVCNFLTVNSPRLIPDATGNFVGQVHKFTHESNRLNDENYFTPYEPIVTDDIKVNGTSANAGGRSGSINLDGFVSASIGANTIDRQSLWLDCAGGIVTSLGRDKQGISCAANMDGDLILQIGGNTIGGEVDSRFDAQYNSVRSGVLDIRVLVNNGQQLIFRLSSAGIDIFSPGEINITSQQSINIKANGNLNLEGTMIQMQAGSTKKVIQKFPATSS